MMARLRTRRMFGYSAVAVGMLASLSLVAADTVSHHGGLAHQEIHVLQKYASNDTSRFRPDADGWLATSICSGEYCVYANKGIANGRGAVMVTNLEGFERFSGRIGSSGKDTAARDKKKKQLGQGHSRKRQEKGTSLQTNRPSRPQCRLCC